MEVQIKKIKESLNNFALTLNENEIKEYCNSFQTAQKNFPVHMQQALAIKLIHDWKNNSQKKTVEVNTGICPIDTKHCVTIFGILGEDWPGLSNTCLGVIHEMGWNACFLKGFSITVNEALLSMVLIGVRTDQQDIQIQLMQQTETILNKLKQAAKGLASKTNLLTEEIRKIEIFSQVITEIESQYTGTHLEEIIGLDGEAVKYFAARSRDYIDNRKTRDIARQIILNYDFIQNAQKSDHLIELDIANFETRKEGIFTGVTVAGPANMLNLEDCLKTIELTTHHFILKHNREFTTKEGISLYRIEFVASGGSPLSNLQQKRLRQGFSTLVLNKKRDRAQWIETIGGFEQYARAIIPLLVREAQETGQTQVYQSVGHTTDLFIDFKIIAVVPNCPKNQKGMFTNTMNLIEQVPGLHVLAAKPPKMYSTTQLFIIDIRASFTVLENVETIYRSIREIIHQSLGEFRDFDEGMRTMDTYKFKSVYQHFDQMDPTLFRELYYSIEDFLRISASNSEIIAHINIAKDMIKRIETKKESIQYICRQTGTHGKSGELIPRANLICMMFPHEMELLHNVLEILNPYEVTLSRIEKSGNDILICRITKNDKVLSDNDLSVIEQQISELKTEVQAE